MQQPLRDLEAMRELMKKDLETLETVREGEGGVEGEREREGRGREKGVGEGVSGVETEPISKML